MADEIRSFDVTPAEVRELGAQGEPLSDSPLLDEIEDDLDEPASHAKRDPAETQGAKTRAATKDQISRRS